MTRFRLFPAVAGAAACLLVLKGLAFLHAEPAPPPDAFAASDIGAGAAFGRAVTRARQGYVPPDPDITGSTSASKKEEPDQAAEAAKLEAARNLSKDQLVPQAMPEVQRFRQTPAERTVLERLGERREELDARLREMEARDALLKAAESKLEGRADALKTLEGRMRNGDEKNEAQAQSLKSLVTMYETMRPKDAARVFDRLDMKVLLPVVTKMNPRKMADILAAMTPETAEKLTVALATRSDIVEKDPGLPPNELPRLDTPPAKP